MDVRVNDSIDRTTPFPMQCIAAVRQQLVGALTDPQLLQVLSDNNVNGTCQNIEVTQLGTDDR